jgi:PAS domain-containing protein
MAQQAVELILMRQLASYLTLPLFLVGADEKLVFYNEAAEALLGRSFDEVGALTLKQLDSAFSTMTEDGTPLPSDQLPVAIALRERRPAHGKVKYRSLDGISHTIEVMAFPLEGQAKRLVGAVAVFWEVAPS